MSQNLLLPYAAQQAVSPRVQQEQQEENPQMPPTSAHPPTGSAAQPASDIAAAGGLDLSALQGISPQQLAVIAQLFQSGQLPLPPPPPPPVSVQPTAPAVTLPGPPTIASPQPSPNTLTNALKPTNQDKDTEKGEGELEDGEVDDSTRQDGFLRSPPKGPRNRGSMRGSHQTRAPTSLLGVSRAPTSSVAAPVISGNQAQAVSRRAEIVTPATSTLPVRPVKDAAVKAFVHELDKAGYSFDQLSKEITNVKLLRRLYDELKIPAVPRRTPSAAPAILNSTPSVPAARKLPTSKPPAKASAPLDRSAYLAKLQAAKNKKVESSQTSVTPPVAPKVSKPLASPKQKPPKPVAPEVPISAPSAPRTPTLSKDKNELIRQRLEKLRAEQAAKQSARQVNVPAAKSSTSTVEPSQAPANSAAPVLGGDLGENAARGLNQESLDKSQGIQRASISNGTTAPSISNPNPPITTASPSLSRGFGLPGLFTTVPPSSPGQKSQQSGSNSVGMDQSTPAVKAAPAAPAPSLPLPKRPDSSSLSTPSGTGAPKRPFGPSKYSYTTDRCVIEVSSEEDDDDDEDDEMDIGNSSNEDETSEEAVSRMSSSRKDVPPRIDLPKATLASASATPTVGTPNADLKRKLAEIEEYKRHIAEVERKRQKNAKVRSQTAQHQTQLDSSGQALSSPSVSNSDQATPMGDSAHAANCLTPTALPSAISSEGPLTRSSSAAIRAAREQEKETLRKRLQELEAIRKGHGIESPASLAAQQASVSATSAETTSDLHETLGLDGQDVEEDDEDLYGADTQAVDTSGDPAGHGATDDRDQEMNQATTTSSDSQVPLNEPTQSGRNEVGNKTDLGLEPDDDDDMENIYQDSASGSAEPQVTEIAGARTFPGEDEVREDNTEQRDPHNDSEDAMDTSDISSTDSGEISDSESEQTPQPSTVPEMVSQPTQGMVGTSVSAGLVTNSNQRPATEDVAPELRPAEEEDVPPHQNTEAKPCYTPYESPLKFFKDYRYHPQYATQVPSGYRSLSYNHKIDAQKTVCPYEIEDGQCGRSGCEFQHFDDMKLNDNELLRLMGAEHTPAKTEEEQRRWREGLTNLIKKLRLSNVGKDAGAIAEHIAEYRRSFIEDPTKTLLLDD